MIMIIVPHIQNRIGRFKFKVDIIIGLSFVTGSTPLP